MKEKIYLYASTEENLTIILKGSQVYDNLTKCILRKSCELMSDKGIKPTSGVLTDAESGKEEYTVYSNCYDLDNKTLYYTTYENRQIVAVTLNEDKNSNRLIAYPFERKQVINKLN